MVGAGYTKKIWLGFMLAVAASAIFSRIYQVLQGLVCAENFIRIDWPKESLNVSAPWRCCASYWPS
jgi:hypothetical protein